MSVFALKVLAMISMVCDHLGYWLSCRGLIGNELYTAMRAFGRLAFPIFAFLIVNGWMHSKSRKGYLKRLMLFALISQLPYVVVFSHANYKAAAGALSFEPPQLHYLLLCLLLGYLYHRFVSADISALLAALLPLVGLSTLKLGGIYLLQPQLNVFYTLAFSLGLICLADMYIDRARHGQRLYGAAAAALAALLLIWNKNDYGMDGIAFILLLWLFRENRMQQLLALLVWSLLHYQFGGGSTIYFICAALAALPLYFYNGRAGKPVKTVFYLVYPLHLSAMAAFIVWQAHL